MAYWATWLPGAGAAPQQAPVVTTDAASGVGASSATLNGTVNANGASTTVTFEYGVTTAYGTTVTADQSPVGGTTDTAVSRQITGLTNGITYHYRAVGQNADGVAYGGDMTVITGATAPDATTNPATGVGVAGATLNGTINANSYSTTVTFEYGLTTAYGTSVTADESPVTGYNDMAVSKQVTGLSPGTAYHFRVAGQNGGGAAYGADRTFTTRGSPAFVGGVSRPVDDASLARAGIGSGLARSDVARGAESQPLLPWHPGGEAWSGLALCLAALGGLVARVRRNSRPTQ